MAKKEVLPELETFTLLNPDFDLPLEENMEVKQEKEHIKEKNPEFLGNAD
jgi:hypothetical protein